VSVQKCIHSGSYSSYQRKGRVLVKNLPKGWQGKKFLIRINKNEKMLNFFLKKIQKGCLNFLKSDTENLS
jgi:hypothetical protein